jgi:hypothetical protein
MATLMVLATLMATSMAPKKVGKRGHPAQKRALVKKAFKLWVKGVNTQKKVALKKAEKEAKDAAKAAKKAEKEAVKAALKKADKEAKEAAKAAKKAEKEAVKAAEKEQKEAAKAAKKAEKDAAKAAKKAEMEAAKAAKLSTKQMAVDRVIQPNSDGISRWVSREELDNAPELNWGNNGAGRHGVYFGDTRYNWEKQGSGKITHLRTNGFNTDSLRGASRPIRDDIHAHHKSMGCVVCGSNSDLVTDHKNDLYNDPRVLKKSTQVQDDFQCLCNHCNLQKRQVARRTLETGERFPATKIPSLAPFGIDFIHGDETFDPNDPDAMVGTYWHDPIEFMKQVNERLTSLNNPFQKN